MTKWGTGWDAPEELIDNVGDNMERAIAVFAKFQERMLTRFGVNSFVAISYYDPLSRMAYSQRSIKGDYHSAMGAATGAIQKFLGE